MSNTRKYYITVICIILVIGILAYISVPIINTATAKAIEEEELVETDNEVATTEVEKNVNVKDPSYDAMGESKGIYNYDHTHVDCLYVTVLEGSESEGTNHNLDEVNSYRNTQDIVGAQKIIANAIVKAGDESGPLEGELGYGENTPNATINCRGRSSTSANQKSYKLKLHDDAGTWHGQRTIALNKHAYEASRLRNMLYYTLLSQVNHLVALRTYFVHLYLSDQTSSGDGTDAYADYGLFTAVEQPNKRFLKQHGLSAGGALYKANMNEFFRNPDKLKLSSDAGYSESAFDEIFEIKTEKDHTKLLNMLDALNDYTTPIDEVLEQYFDVDNIVSFLAFNMLMGNRDCNSQNYYLYSPINDDKWYFLPWDGDGCLLYTEQELVNSNRTEGAWENGISNFMGNVLYNRMLHEKVYRDKLTDRVNELHKLINEDTVRALISKYDAVVRPYTETLPDKAGMITTSAIRDKILEGMPKDVERSYKYYMESLEKPMPFYIADTVVENGKLVFSWDASYDFNGSAITYRMEVATDPGFISGSYVLDEYTKNIHFTSDMLDDGIYYIRVRAYNEKGIEGTSFEQYLGDKSYDSTRPFRILDKGKKVLNGAEHGQGME